MVQDTDNLEQWLQSITLMTIHAAKGLEFDTVFVVWMEEWIFPSSKVEDDDFALEEERRLAYVAVTRAKRNLYLLNTKNRMLYWKFQNNAGSRFLWEISRDLIDELDVSYVSRFWTQDRKKNSNWVNVPSWVDF